MFIRLTPALLAIGALASAALASAAPVAADAGDPLLREQWALAPDGAMGAPEAWARSLGGGVVVAVLDTGVQLDHPDLRANLWTNPDEVPANGIDDDRDGYVDDVHGASIIGHSGRPADDNGHGTHVAGIVAAAAGNGEGGSGVAPRSRIMAVKVLDANKAGNTAGLAAGIRYAVRHGADILNVSINGEVATEDLKEAIELADGAGVTVVASAGNNARDIDARPSYPASLAAPNILSVTATESDDTIWSPGNFGARSVDLAAPGSGILSTFRDSAYDTWSGTSMAAPHVSGGFALLQAARPDASASQLRAALLTGARRSGELTGMVGAGSLDVAAALRSLLPVTGNAGPSRPRSRVSVRSPRRVRAGRVTLRWRTGRARGVARWRVLLDGRVVARVRSGRPLRATARVRPGRHRWRVTGLNANGHVIALGTARFRAVRR